MSQNLPVIAIIGRPNVGKSTLFNRISDTRKAVVLDTPGVTRDRNYTECDVYGHKFMLVDTGGYDPDEEGDLAYYMREQIQIAIDDADAMIFLTDCNQQNHATDFEMAEMMRKSNKPVFLAVNKSDNPQMEIEAYSFSELGLSDIFPISALHGSGVAELLETVLETLPKAEIDDENHRIRIAVVGRQNVGKSTLVNQILGEDRVIASNIAGTTRDSIDTPFTRNGKDFLLIDTAGIRRRGKIEKGIEKLSVFSAMVGMKSCDIVLIVINAEEGIKDQDTHIAGIAEDTGALPIFIVNKWDTLEKDNKTAGEFVAKVREHFKFLAYAPIQFISAKTGEKVGKIFPIIDRVWKQYHKRASTGKVNEVIEHALVKHSPPRRGVTRLKIKYATQSGTAPPIFTLFVNNPDLLHFSYRRYLVNQLREAFELTEVPVRITLRKKSDDRFDKEKK